ncbi:MAG: hypothetical protein AAFX05_01955 [Planctomycetota bacterium]
MNYREISCAIVVSGLAGTALGQATLQHGTDASAYDSDMYGSVTDVIAVNGGPIFHVRDKPDSGESTTAQGADIYVENTSSRPRRSPPNSNENYNVGVFEFQLDAGNGFFDFLTFCLEPGIPLPGDLTTMQGAEYELKELEDFGPTLTDEEICDLELLWFNAFELTTTGDEMFTAQDYAAAFQLFVWEVASDDTPFNLQGGEVGVFAVGGIETRIVNIGNTWRDNIDDGIWTEKTELQFLFSEDGQDLLFPTPGAATLLAFAGIGAGTRRRRSA